jgi:hypothetical protein
LISSLESVEIRALADLLEDLLYNPAEAGEDLHLAEATSVAVADLAALREEYELRYARAVAAVSELRGEPSFAGATTDPGFPLGLGCDQATCWQGPAGVIYVGLSCKQDGFLLLGGARGRATVRDIATLPPPAN